MRQRLVSQLTTDYRFLSVKNTDTAQHKGYDAGKKVSGIKRHIAVDTQGLPHAIAMTTADVNDRSGALLMFLLNDDSLSEVRDVLLDGAYTYTPASDLKAWCFKYWDWERRRKSSNAMSCTSLLSSPSAGLSSAYSPGWRSVAGYAKTANANCIPVNSLSCSHSCRSC